MIGPIPRGVIMDVVVWLRSLGLGQYEAVIRENEIDDTVLPSLTAEDLRELGVAALGHRRRLLDGNQNVNAMAATSRALAANIRMATASLRITIVASITGHPPWVGGNSPDIVLFPGAHAFFARIACSRLLGTNASALGFPK